MVGNVKHHAEGKYRQQKAQKGLGQTPAQHPPEVFEECFQRVAHCFNHSSAGIGKFPAHRTNAYIGQKITNIKDHHSDYVRKERPATLLVYLAAGFVPDYPERRDICSSSGKLSQGGTFKDLLHDPHPLAEDMLWELPGINCPGYHGNLSGCISFFAEVCNDGAAIYGNYTVQQHKQKRKASPQLGKAETHKLDEYYKGYCKKIEGNPQP